MDLWDQKEKEFTEKSLVVLRRAKHRTKTGILELQIQIIAFKKALESFKEVRKIFPNEIENLDKMIAGLQSDILEREDQIKEGEKLLDEIEFILKEFDRYGQN